MQVFKSLDGVEVTKRLKDGQVAVLPSDTIYGLMADASNEEAVNKLYGLKSREGKPGTIIATSIDQLVDIGVERRYLKAVEQFWPGPVSVELPCGVEYLNRGTGKVAVRVVSDKKVAALLEKTGALATTSANHPGEAAAVTIKQAQKYFKDEVDFYVDIGDLSGRPPSTVIRIVDDAVEVIREGAVKIDEASGTIVS